MKISFDYDGVLNAYDYNPSIPYPTQDEPRLGMRELVERLYAEGHELWVVTARVGELFNRVEDDLTRWNMYKYFDDYGPQENRIISRGDKAKYCTAAKINIHIDDHPSIIQQFYDARSTTIPVHFLPGLPSIFDIHVTTPRDLYTVIRLFDTGVVKGLADWQTRRTTKPREAFAHRNHRTDARDTYEEQRLV